VFVIFPDNSGYQVSFGHWPFRADAEQFKAAVESDGTGRRVAINPEGVWDNVVSWTAGDSIAARVAAVA